MWYWILKTAIVSICAIALIHHITYLLKTQLTSPKIKDLVNVDVSAGQFYAQCINVRANNCTQNTETQNTETQNTKKVVHADADAPESLEPKTTNAAEMAEMASGDIDQGLVMYLKERLD